MSVPAFNVQEQWIGDGTLAEYTFDFTIQALDHLIVIVQDTLGNEVERVRGSDTSYLSGVVFDAIDGGGTVTLQGVLANEFVITFLMANDEPTQPSEFKNKFSFTLERFESALDFIVTALQRVAWLAGRSLRINDVVATDFDPQLPAVLIPDAFLKVNEAGDGFDFGPTEEDLTDIVTAAATAALAAEVEAAEHAAQSAADAATAAAAAVSTATDATIAATAAADAAAAAALAATFTGQVHSGPFAAIAPNANLNLPAEITDHTLITMVEYTARIIRGTTIYARQEFVIFYRNGAWKIAIGQNSYDDAGADHGVTFTVDPATAQINAAVANDGGSNAIIDLNKIGWDI